MSEKKPNGRKLRLQNIHLILIGVFTLQPIFFRVSQWKQLLQNLKFQSYWLSSFHIPCQLQMKRAEEGKEKKFLSVERCFWPVGTDFTLNLICFSQKSTDNLEITILCLQSYLLFFAEQVEMQVYIIYAIFCTPKQLIHTDCKHTKNQGLLLGKKN